MVPLLERLQGDQFRELTAQDFCVATKVMTQDLRSLLVLGKIATLIETARARRIHEEVRWSGELHNQAASSRAATMIVALIFSRIKGDILDRGEGKFDLVASRVIVDVISNARLIR